MTTLPFPFWFRSIGTFLPSGLASVLGDWRRDHEEAGLVPAQDLVAKATQAAREAQNLPPGPDELRRRRRRTGSATRRIPTTILFPANPNGQIDRNFRRQSHRAGDAHFRIVVAAF